MAREQTGISGEFWFFSQLQRLGYETFITLGNTKGVDIALRLKNNSVLTFEVKSKLNFGGSFQYLDNVEMKENHYVVFVDLSAKKSKEGKTIFTDNPNCYILESKNLPEIAFNWQSASGTSTGYGFEAKILWYLKFQDTKNITQNNIENFIDRHNLKGDIDFEYYNNIILTLPEFEDIYYSLK